MDELEEDRELKPLLSSFSCSQDVDIEQFLHNRAVEFERLSKARTYLIFSEEELNSKNIVEQTIYGYLSVALKVLSVPDTLSNRMRTKLDGLSAKIHGERIRDFPCYLIGQLARNSNVSKDVLSGEQLLQFADSIIAPAVSAVGGRYVMIECHDRQALIDFYQRNEYSEISRIPDEGCTMIQMIRKIPSNG